MWSRAVCIQDQKSVELLPNDGNRWNTLGVAYYRAGQWEEAITASGKSRELGAGGHEGVDLFFIAMAHWQLGKKDEARQFYDQAVEWTEQKQPDNDELASFGVEAGELLGVSEPTDGKVVVPESEEQGISNKE